MLVARIATPFLLFQETRTSITYRFFFQISHILLWLYQTQKMHLPADFMAGPFVMRYEPIQHPIHTPSSLYRNTDAAEESDNEEELLDQREENHPFTDTDGKLLLPSHPPLEETNRVSSCWCLLCTFPTSKRPSQGESQGDLAEVRVKTRLVLSSAVNNT